MFSLALPSTNFFLGDNLPLAVNSGPYLNQMFLPPLKHLPEPTFSVIALQSQNMIW